MRRRRWSRCRRRPTSCEWLRALRRGALRARAEEAQAPRELQAAAGPLRQPGVGEHGKEIRRRRRRRPWLTASSAAGRGASWMRRTASRSRSRCVPSAPRPSPPPAEGGSQPPASAARPGRGPGCGPARARGPAARRAAAHARRCRRPHARRPTSAASCARDVAPDVKNAAMKKLFADPHFNVMDGMDTYIDDYSKPDPIPPSHAQAARQRAVSRTLP